MDMSRPLFPSFAFHVLIGVTESCVLAAMPTVLGFAAETHPRKLLPVEYIDQRCTFCHSRILSIVLLNRWLDANGVEATDAFLEGHHMPDAEARDVIMRYLGDTAD